MRSQGIHSRSDLHNFLRNSRIDMATWARNSGVDEHAIQRCLDRLDTRRVYLEAYIQEWTVQYFGRMISEPIEVAMANLLATTTLTQARNWARIQMADPNGPDLLPPSPSHPVSMPPSVNDGTAKSIIFWSLEEERNLAEMMDVIKGRTQ